MCSDVAITATQLSKHYHIYDRPSDRLKQAVFRRRHYGRRFTALHDVSIEIHRGETIGLMGRNGSGKSTLLKILAGVLTPSAGTVTAHGRVSALLELGSGFNPDFTGRENVRLNAAVLGFSRDDINARMDQILAFADIGDFVDQPVKTYSSGMAVRLAFALAVNVEPDILIVDEALAVGDEPFRAKCHARMRAFQDKGGTLFYATHDPNSIVQNCDRALLLDRGEVLLVGPPRSIATQYHRLIYAGAADYEAVRRSILAMPRSGPAATAPVVATAVETSETDAELGLAAPEAASDTVPTGTLSEEDEVAVFDPAIVTVTSTPYPPNGARITNARLLTRNGRPINHLRRGKTYIFAYDVQIERPVTALRSGMFFRTLTGIALGGGGLAPDAVAARCEPGDVFTAWFEFDVRLNAGTYTISCGVHGVDDGTRHLLHAVADAAMFRVLAEPASNRGGIVDFDIQATLWLQDRTVVPVVELSVGAS